VTKLIWLLDWMLSDGKSTPGADELAWRAACLRVVKLSAFAMIAAWAILELGRYGARRAAQRYESLATVLWLGDASYDHGAPAYNGHASATHHVWQDGVHLQIDGLAEPATYEAGATGGLRNLSVGERVRVRYRRGAFLFWQEMRVLGVSKLDDAAR